MKEKEEEEKRENQKVADLLFDLDSRLLGMELLGRFDMERIVTILDMSKFESDQKEKIALWFGQSRWHQPFTGSNVSWHLSALQKLGIIPWKDWDDDIYDP